MEEKEAFMTRLKRIIQYLTPPAGPLTNNRKLMTMLFDKVEIEATPPILKCTKAAHICGKEA